MLAPAMATMLAVVTTDARARPRPAAGRADPRGRTTRFNQLCVDGCTSTNDTVLVLANGASGVAIGDDRSLGAFTDALTEVCGSLAEQMARDAEGATKFARITVRGARLVRRRPAWPRARSRRRSSSSARSTARTRTGAGCSRSSASSGAEFDPEQVEIAYNGIVACRDGIDAADDPDGARADHEGSRRSTSSATCRPGRTTALDALHRPLARLHRREPGHVVSDATRQDDCERAAWRASAHDKARDPRRGAAVHPRVLRPDRRHQVRRPRDGRSRARRPVRPGRRAHAPRRDEPGRRARRRPADQRAHAPARQGARVPRRAAGHRRRDRRHRAHGARRQGEPRGRRVAQPARLVRGRALRRGRRAHPGGAGRRAPRASSARSATSTRRSSSGSCARS